MEQIEQQLRTARQVILEMVDHLERAAIAAYDGDVIDIPTKLANRIQFEMEQLPNV